MGNPAYGINGVSLAFRRAQARSTLLSTNYKLVPAVSVLPIGLLICARAVTFPGQAFRGRPKPEGLGQHRSGSKEKGNIKRYINKSRLFSHLSKKTQGGSGKTQAICQQTPKTSFAAKIAQNSIFHRIRIFFSKTTLK